MTDTPSTLVPQRVLVVAGLLLATVALTAYAYLSHAPKLLILIPAFSVVVFLISRLPFAFAATIALSTSYLTLPGLPSKANLYFLLMALVSAGMIAHAIVAKETRPRRPQSKWVIFMMAVLLGTAYLRGFGLRAIGGEAWGGFNYIVMMLASVFFLASIEVDLTERQWKRAVVWMCLLSLVPVGAQAIYALSGGKLYHVFYLVAPEFQVLEYMFQREQGSGLARLQQANIAAQYLFILALLLAPQKAHRKWVFLLVLLSLVMAGIAGNRISIIFNTLLLGAYIFSDTRRTIAQTLSHPLTLAALVVLLLLSQLATYLPPTFQRVFSVLPFAKVSWEVSMAASGTIAWRMEVWARALQQVPDYLLLGKGFAFSAQEVMTITARQLYMNDIEYVLASHNYHNGMLHTLLDLGLLGLLAAVGFIASVLYRHGPFLRRTWQSPALRHYHRVVLSVFVATVIVYFVLAGGVTHLCTLFFWAILLEGFLRADQRLGSWAAPARPPMRRLTSA